jgi:hypothetical protein
MTRYVILCEEAEDIATLDPQERTKVILNIHAEIGHARIIPTYLALKEATKERGWKGMYADVKELLRIAPHVPDTTKDKEIFRK